MDSWTISISDSSPLIDAALWIRAAERLQVPDDPLVPGPLDIDRPPAPPISTADDSLAQEWLGWWLSLVAPGHHGLPPTGGGGAALATGTPDPLGLAPYPVLAELVTRRWPQIQRWHGDRRLAQMGLHLPTAKDVVVAREVERALGRRLRPFAVEFVLLPVRDEAIRRVDDGRYLVPERVYRGPGWTVWLRSLMTRIG